MFNKNTSAPDRFPTGGQRYCKLPSVTFIFFENSLCSYHSNHLHCWALQDMMLGLETLVPLSSVPCACNWTFWCQSTHVLTSVTVDCHFPPIRLLHHYTGASEPPVRSLKRQLQLKSLLKSYCLIEWCLERCFFLLSLCKYPQPPPPFFLCFEISTGILGSSPGTLKSREKHLVCLESKHYLASGGSFSVRILTFWSNECISYCTWLLCEMCKWYHLCSLVWFIPSGLYCY